MPLSIYKQFYLEDNSILNGFSTNETNANLTYVPREEFTEVIRSPVLRRYTKVYLLHPDETINKDITEYVLMTGSIEKNNQEGQCRSSNLTFINPLVYKTIVDDYNNYGKRKSTPESLWNPMLFNDDFHANVKISCIDFYDARYEIDEGIFVTFDPKLSESGANTTLSVQLYDKFALLDGTIDGKNDLDYEIPVNTPIYEAIRQLLRLPKNNRGEPYDVKDIIFPAKYKETLLAYTIKKTGENSVGDIIKEMVKSIACKVSYNANGNLVIADVLADMDYHYRSALKLKIKF